MPVPPGEVCPACDRKVPHVHDKPPGPKRERWTIAVPPGDEGLLDTLLVQWTELLQPQWDREGEGMQLGATGWRFRSVAAGLQTLVELARVYPNMVFGMGDAQPQPELGGDVV